MSSASEAADSKIILGQPGKKRRPYAKDAKDAKAAKLFAPFALFA
jgi:hypothetical protein